MAQPAAVWRIKLALASLSVGISCCGEPGHTSTVVGVLGILPVRPIWAGIGMGAPACHQTVWPPLGMVLEDWPEPSRLMKLRLQDAWQGFPLFGYAFT
jgi:hypothetical protein